MNCYLSSQIKLISDAEITIKYIANLIKFTPPKKVSASKRRNSLHKLSQYLIPL